MTRTRRNRNRASNESDIHARAREIMNQASHVQQMRDEDARWDAFVTTVDPDDVETAADSLGVDYIEMFKDGKTSFIMYAPWDAPEMVALRRWCENPVGPPPTEMAV